MKQYTKCLIKETCICAVKNLLGLAVLGLIVLVGITVIFLWLYVGCWLPAGALTDWFYTVRPHQVNNLPADIATSTTRTITAVIIAIAWILAGVFLSNSYDQAKQTCDQRVEEQKNRR